MPARQEADATILQSTCDIMEEQPIVAMAVCATVLMLLIAAAFAQVLVFISF
jgi:hypothetical protein